MNLEEYILPKICLKAGKELDYAKFKIISADYCCNSSTVHYVFVRTAWNRADCNRV